MTYLHITQNLPRAQASLKTYSTVSTFEYCSCTYLCPMLQIVHRRTNRPTKKMFKPTCGQQDSMAMNNVQKPLLHYCQNPCFFFYFFILFVLTVSKFLCQDSKLNGRFLLFLTYVYTSSAPSSFSPCASSDRLCWN